MDWKLGVKGEKRGNESRSVQFSSVTQSCLTLCDPMNRSTPGLPVHHQLPESTQTHIHCVGDAIQPSHPLLSPSSPALNLSQHQGLFQWVSSSHQVAKVLEFQLQHQSFQWINQSGLISFRMDWLNLLAVQGTLKSLLQQIKGVNMGRRQQQPELNGDSGVGKKQVTREVIKLGDQQRQNWTKH